LLMRSAAVELPTVTSAGSLRLAGNMSEKSRLAEWLPAAATKSTPLEPA